MRTLVAAVVCAAIAPANLLVAADKPRVAFELLTKPDLPLDVAAAVVQGAHRPGHFRAANSQPGQAGEEMEISESGSKGSRQYRVVGILAADNRLYLPGGKFSVSDTARLRKWLDNLGDDGPQASPTRAWRSASPPASWNKSPTTCTSRSRSTTKEFAASTAVGRIAAGLKYPLEVDDAARRG